MMDYYPIASETLLQFWAQGGAKRSILAGEYASRPPGDAMTSSSRLRFCLGGPPEYSVMYNKKIFETWILFLYFKLS